MKFEIEGLSNFSAVACDGKLMPLLKVLSEVAKLQRNLGELLFADFSFEELVECFKKNKSLVNVLNEVAKKDVDGVDWIVDEHFDGLLGRLLAQEAKTSTPVARVKKARLRYLRGVAYWVSHVGGDVFDDYLAIKLVAIVSVEFGIAMGLIGSIGLDESLKVVTRKGASARYEIHRQAEKFVQEKWRHEKSAYGGNKSEFARTYVRIVKQLYLTRAGDPLVVTQETIRNSWLKGL